MSSSATRAPREASSCADRQSDTGRSAGDGCDEALEVAACAGHEVHSGPSGNPNLATLSACMRALNPGAVGAA